MMRVRSLLSLGALVTVAILLAPAGPAHAGEDAVEAAGQQRPYTMSLGRDLNLKWHAEGAGQITFYDGLRRFRVSGLHRYHQSTSDTAPGYPQVRQNLANTSQDPGWIRITEDQCDRQTTIFGADVTCRVRARTHYFETPTQPGHGLAGLWVRFCKEVPGPDQCGRGGQVGYADNPYL